ncbi:hypothetical protein scyTo_0023404 [Scyliorhinus torazame]|uniref:Guanine nucleotide-binding protein subunit gamma n=1 Tax=Scyliorhinus torazame TaxID=75743 RepID=A0A401QCF3_SCYTO|nr:hypothetical protein [Scyliorhinus torazame]
MAHKLKFLWAEHTSSLSVAVCQMQFLTRQTFVLKLQVSQAATELQQYCVQNACKDALLVGLPAGSNPFRDPRSCNLL